VALLALLLTPAAAALASVTTAPSDCTPLALRPALASPVPGDIYLRAGAATCTGIDVEVAASGLAGVFTVAFDLRYPVGLLRYEGYAEGSLLSRGAPRTRPFYLVQQPAPGRIQVTMTRFSPDGAATAADQGESMIVLRFSRVSPGSAVLDFDLDPSSPVAERVVDAGGLAVDARFGPGHGATITVP
jgi:hypothetical protein